MKTCTKCKIEQPVEGFYRTSTGGISAQCKECQKAYSRKQTEYKEINLAIDCYIKGEDTQSFVKSTKWDAEKSYTVKCTTCDNLVKRSRQALKAMEKTKRNIVCGDCKGINRAKYYTNEYKKKGREHKKVYEKSLLAKITSQGLQDECENCGRRYSINARKCPHCGTINHDIFCTKT